MVAAVQERGRAGAAASAEEEAGPSPHPLVAAAGRQTLGRVRCGSERVVGPFEESADASWRTTEGFGRLCSASRAPPLPTYSPPL